MRNFGKDGRMNRLVAGLVALLLAFASVRPATSVAISPQHLDDVRNGYRALTTTFYRGVAADRLVAGARDGIAAAFRKRKAAPPALPARRDDDAPKTGSARTGRGRAMIASRDS